jgi:predicted metalloprotease with PDZ domain
MRRCLSLLLLLASCALAQTPKPALSYQINTSEAAHHRLHVTIHLPEGPDQRELQLPVWNALYQVRDFAQYVVNLSATDPQKQPLAIRAINPSRWRLSGAARGATIEYDFIAELPLPFGTVADGHHVFINPAEVLMYSDDTRGRPIVVMIGKNADGWDVATALTPMFDSSMGRTNVLGFQAKDYDQLTDSPFEISGFKEASFDEGGVHYRIVVDGDPADYDMQKLVEQNRKIVRFETEWMQPDRSPAQIPPQKPPFDHYLFIYHFPRGPAGGGMEHAYSTAISVSVSRLQRDPNATADVTAHEFFHAWNVKRIRPQCLEPVDYAHEQPCDALWFSEGVTSTVSELALLRAGFVTAERYLAGIAREIQSLQSRPAHRFMSAEESSVGTWLDKYPAYRQPERSVDYYNKGFLLGVLLDLQMREASGGKKSLRDLFLYLDANFARQGKFFANSDGIRQAAEAVASTDFRDFWRRYVSGTEEIPYDDFFRTVGLHLQVTSTNVADPGFSAERAFGSLTTTVNRVSPGSPALAAGLRPGDVIAAINGEENAPLERALSGMHPGDTLRLRIVRAGQPQELQFKLGSRAETEYQLLDMETVTPLQRARRNQWLFGVAGEADLRADTAVSVASGTFARALHSSGMERSDKNK